MASLVIIARVQDVEQINAALDLAGYGPRTLSVPMRGPVAVDDIEQATHYGCHWNAGDDYERIVEIVKSNSTEAKILASHVEPIAGVEIQGVDGALLFQKPAGENFYIPVDPKLIEQFTRSLFKLINSEKEGSYARIVKNPDEIYWPLLELRENDIIPLSLEADIEPLRGILQAFVEGHGITEGELSAIVQGVQALAGQQVKLVSFIPPSWQPYILSRDQAKNLGYEV